MKLHDDGCQLKGNVSDVEDLCSYSFHLECLLNNPVDWILGFKPGLLFYSAALQSKEYEIPGN